MTLSTTARRLVACTLLGSSIFVATPSAAAAQVAAAGELRVDLTATRSEPNNGLVFEISLLNAVADPVDGNVIDILSAENLDAGSYHPIFESIECERLTEPVPADRGDFVTNRCEYLVAVVPEPGLWALELIVDGSHVAATASVDRVELPTYEEGRALARNETVLNSEQTVVDLETFVRTDPFICLETNIEGCFETGFYDEWVDRYFLWLADEPLFVEGFEGGVHFIAEIGGLPVGANGFRAVVAYERAADDEPAVRGEVTLDEICGFGPCGEVVTALPVGDYRTMLKIYNDHPFAEYANGETWGGGVEFRSFDGPSFTAFAPPAPPAVRAIVGRIVDGRFTDPGDRLRIDYWARNRPGRSTIGRFSLRVRGDTTLNVRSVGVDDLVGDDEQQQASGRGILRDGTPVLWELTIDDSTPTGISEYAVRIVRRDDPFEVIYETDFSPFDRGYTQAKFFEV